MGACWPHVEYGPDPQCPGTGPSQTEVAGRVGGAVALRLPSSRAPPRPRASHSGGATRTALAPDAGDAASEARGPGSPRARPGVIVLDASAALDLVLRTPAGEIVADRIGSPEETLHSPHLIDLEVAQVLRRYEASRALSPLRAREALDDFTDLDVTRYPHEIL